MGLAPYFQRAGVAVSQVIAGYNAETFKSLLNSTAVGVSFTTDDVSKPQGDAFLDLVVRLLARLYPKVSIVGTGTGAAEKVDAVQALARRINPNIEFVDHAEVGITIGTAPTVPTWPTTVYAGSDTWTGTVSTTTPAEVGDDHSPFGAGIAACLAAAVVFRIVCLGEHTSIEGTLSAFEPGTEPDLTTGTLQLPGPAALVGNGAIGHGALWALGRTKLAGALHCLDDEPIDGGNLQRYVLATVDDIGKPKAEFAAEFLNTSTSTLKGLGIDHHWPEAVELHGSVWSSVAIAVDTAEARREVQATLPEWVANSWTQTGDLAVSEHNFLNSACVCCLYLPVGRSKNQDEVVATALRIPEKVREVRELLYSGAPTPPPMLALIGERLSVTADDLARFDGLPIRELYTAGICGSALLTVPEAGDLHVPLAHQSALAGVLLAARLVRRATGHFAQKSEICRVDALRDPPQVPFQKAAKDPRGICICQDPDFVAAYHAMWS